jgi:formylglycine-generating enzyme required for sulfatase activity
MVLIPGGEFVMGSDGQQDAGPPRTVTVSPFYMDRFEVTQEHYERLMGKNPARRKGPQNPVERVRWTDALRFCNARSGEEGFTPCYNLETWACDFSADGYRLPTEAEWEYACRAGSPDDYYFKGGAEQLEAYAWFRDNAGRKHHPAGQKEPNAFGLYDMAGNVREWCNDWYAVDAYSAQPAVDPHGPASGEKAVLRGGAFSGSAETCTSWNRYCDEPGFTDACVASDDYGFRCVKRIPTDAKP